jgi:hypothetical protein
MRRPTRLGLAAIALLLVLFGAYAAYWRSVAGRIEDGVVAWQQSMRARKIDASWQKLRVAGFPFAFRVEMASAVLRDRALNPAPELRLPALTGSTRPWDFAEWKLAAPQGLSADLAAAGRRPPVKLAAQTAEGTAAAGPEGAATLLWFNLHGVSAEAGDRVPINSAVAWITLPATPPRAHTDPSLGLAIDLRQVRLPASPPSFSNTIDELALGVTVKGAVPDGPLAEAVAAWRDAGGTVEFDNLHLRWGGLGATANGTIALDRQLQPIGAFSGGIQGFGEILNALVEADRMTAEQAALAQIALTTLAKAGPDGKPQITTSFTIQNGKMYLGPARLGDAPRIVWQ